MLPSSVLYNFDKKYTDRLTLVYIIHNIGKLKGKRFTKFLLKCNKSINVYNIRSAFNFNFYYIILCQYWQPIENQIQSLYFYQSNLKVLKNLNFCLKYLFHTQIHNAKFKFVFFYQIFKLLTWFIKIDTAFIESDDNS